MSSNKRTVPMPEGILEELLSAIEPIVPEAEVEQRIHSQLMARVQRGRQPEEQADDQLVTVAAGNDDWVQAGSGNSIKLLRTDDDSMSMLVRLDPGATFPSHYHPQDEETYVIEGETWFGDTHLVAGDYHLARKGSTHGEVRTETGCTLFIRKANE